MEESYNAHGIQFQYPSDWTVEENVNEFELSVVVSSPASSFWSFTLHLDRPDPAELVKRAEQAFRGEYSELDVYPVQATMFDRPIAARDIEFVCMELIASAFVRSFATPQGTALILYQGADDELAETRELLEKISTSLSIQMEEGPESFWNWEEDAEHECE